MFQNKFDNNILNIAAGKLTTTIKEYDKKSNNFIVNLDTLYKGFFAKDVNEINTIYKNIIPIPKYVIYCKSDIFKFFENNLIFFDKMYMYRFLEHIERDKILYFIYLVSQNIKKGSNIEIIVPNYISLARKLLDFKINNKNFHKDYIILNTECLNEKFDPHTSIWTPDLAKYFWELEERFEVINMIENFEFDGRDIYMKFKAKRI